MSLLLPLVKEALSMLAAFFGRVQAQDVPLGPPKYGGRLHILNLTGDTERVWSDREGAETVEALFKELKAKGYTAFRILPNGTGEQQHSFDPAARTVMAPPYVGG